ncbi:hypothetical protein [Sabulicella rubraurantiaca]|uniref:hypothetical protein n=1 Tax=Sabulicella rubraurantiaca TaxID=2811429 RepID=UPI001A97A1C0|nr:hypothetical protein [Sabulicella rubraurantiaca]
MSDELELVEPVGPEGGPQYRYRGAEISCNEVGAICRLRLDGHPFDGQQMGDAQQFGAPVMITSLVDLWVTAKRLPYWLTAAPKTLARR